MLTQKIYAELLSNGEVNQHDIEIIFEPYTSKLQAAESNSDISLFDLFVEFLQGNIQEFKQWPFQKLSSVV
jgi:hypothetical protein